MYREQGVEPQTGTPFAVKGETPSSPLGIPQCTPPPWGILAEVDLARGEIVCRTVLSDFSA